MMIFCDILIYAQEVTILRPACAWSYTSARQWWTEEEGQYCTIWGNWAV